MHDSPESNGIEAVFLANRDKLIRFLAAHGAGDAAEDLLQELWLKLSASPSGPIAQPLAYLFRAANNLMLDRYRSVRQEVKRERAWSETTGPATPGRSDEPSAERTLLAREQLRRVQAALDAIGERAAAIFRRHRIDGVPQRDIAAEMGVSLSTVESDLRKAYRAVIEARGELE